MHILYTDETNIQPSGDIKFFIYGGLIVDVDRMGELQARIEEIRRLAGYGPEDLLKFDTNSRPDHVDHETATEAKRQVIQACLDCDCLFIAYAIHHAILINADLQQQVLWAADHVISRFNKFLGLRSGEGICVVDNLPGSIGQREYLVTKFSVGLTLHTGSTMPLSNIRLFAASHIGASHLASAVDIVLGTFRFCVNNAPSPMSQEMMQSVALLMWHQIDDEGNPILLENGLIFRPRTIRSIQYQRDYQLLHDHMVTLLSDDST